MSSVPPAPFPPPTPPTPPLAGRRDSPRSALALLLCPLSSTAVDPDSCLTSPVPETYSANCRIIFCRSIVFCLRSYPLALMSGDAYHGYWTAQLGWFAAPTVFALHTTRSRRCQRTWSGSATQSITYCNHGKGSRPSAWSRKIQRNPGLQGAIWVMGNGVAARASDCMPRLRIALPSTSSRTVSRPGAPSHLASQICMPRSRSRSPRSRPRNSSYSFSTIVHPRVQSLRVSTQVKPHTVLTTASPRHWR